jgi:hypothetical protein
VSTQIRATPVVATQDDAAPLEAPRTDATRVALALLVTATALIALAYASAFGEDGPPSWSAWLLATGVPMALVGVMVLGAARAGRLPRSLALAFTVVGLMLAGGFALALALPAGLGAAEPLILGLPRRAAIVVYGVGLLPVLVLPAAYAMTFDAQTLREEDLARVRAAAAEWRAERSVAEREEGR